MSIVLRKAMVRSRVDHNLNRVQCDTVERGIYYANACIQNTCNLSVRCHGEWGNFPGSRADIISPFPMSSRFLPLSHNYPSHHSTFICICDLEGGTVVSDRSNCVCHVRTVRSACTLNILDHLSYLNVQCGDWPF